MNIDQAFAILKENHKEWAESGLRMVNHNDVEEAMRCLFANMPFQWGEAYKVWERDNENEFNDAVQDLIWAWEKEFNTEEHAETRDDEFLIIMDDNQEVRGTCLHLTYRHFRRLRAAFAKVT